MNNTTITAPITFEEYLATIKPATITLTAADGDKNAVAATTSIPALDDWTETQEKAYHSALASAAKAAVLALHAERYPTTLTSFTAAVYNREYSLDVGGTNPIAVIAPLASILPAEKRHDYKSAAELLNRLASWDANRSHDKDTAKDGAETAKLMSTLKKQLQTTFSIIQGDADEKLLVNNVDLQLFLHQSLVCRGNKIHTAGVPATQNFIEAACFHKLHKSAFFSSILSDNKNLNGLVEKGKTMPVLGADPEKPTADKPEAPAEK